MPQSRKITKIYCPLCHSAFEIKSDRMVSGLPEYRAWYKMLSRCQNPADRNFKHYGGRGIAVCERWHLFDNFLADMGLRPSLKYNIGRINNDGHYEPENCRWETIDQKLKKYRRNRMITISGVTHCLMDWSIKSGIPYRTIQSRINLGWKEEDLLSPARIYKKRS